MLEKWIFYRIGTAAINKQIMKLILRFLIAIGLLIWAFSQVNLQQLGDAIKDVIWPFLIANWAIWIGFGWLTSVKMRLILKKQGCDVGVHTLFGISAITSLYGLVMPGLLSSTVKWYFLKKNTGKGVNVFSGMVYNQLTEIVSIIVFGLMAIIITNPTKILLPDIKNQYLLPVVCGILLAGVIIISFLLLNERTGGSLIKIMGYAVRVFPAKARAKGEEILTQIATFHTVGWRFHFLIALVTVASTFVGCVATFVLCAKGANIAVSIWVLIWLSAIVGILGKIPISVANLGVREVTLVQFLAFYSIEPSASLLMSMMFLSGALFMGVVGAGYQLLWALRPEKHNPISAKNLQ